MNKFQVLPIFTVNYFDKTDPSMEIKVRVLDKIESKVNEIEGITSLT